MRLARFLPLIALLPFVLPQCAKASRIDDGDGEGGRASSTAASGTSSASGAQSSTGGATASTVVASTSVSVSESASATTGNPDPCGNGTIDVNEECDDANAIDDDGCTACVIDCDVAAGELKAAANQHCYRFVTTQRTWADAEADCVAWGKAPGLGHLASIADATENAFVQAMAGAGIWIGANDLTTEGVFAWSDGTPFAFVSWAGGEPNDDGTEDCAILQPNGLWRDTECGNGHIYACERSGAGE